MTQTVEQAEAALKTAESALLSELKADCERRDGSGAQERRREEHQQSLRDDVYECERNLESAKRRQVEASGTHA
jgi:hypothetical protein